MERTHKSWGEKWNIFQNDLCEVSILYLNPYCRCSYHSHQAKWNNFFVISGILYIKTEWGISQISEGQTFTVKPGELHEFQTHESPCTLHETMYVRYDPEDINRQILGGPLNE